VRNDIKYYTMQRVSLKEHGSRKGQHRTAKKTMGEKSSSSSLKGGAEFLRLQNNDRRIAN
jgi:hypothetical protein